MASPTIISHASSLLQMHIVDDRPPIFFFYSRIGLKCFNWCFCEKFEALVNLLCTWLLLLGKLSIVRSQAIYFYVIETQHPTVSLHMLYRNCWSGRVIYSDISHLASVSCLARAILIYLTIQRRTSQAYYWIIPQGLWATRLTGQLRSLVEWLFIVEQCLKSWIHIHTIILLLLPHK